MAKTPPSKVVPEQSVATAEEQLGDPSGSKAGLDGFMSLLDRATPEQAVRIREKLGLGNMSLVGAPKVPKKRQRMSNQQVQAFVAANGDVIRNDPDYQPLPSQAVEEKGPLAVQRFLEKWENGQTVGAMDRSEMDLMAQEALEHQSEMEAKLDGGNAPKFDR
jgi:hypothetical protein